jgi:hypothetical protein
MDRLLSSKKVFSGFESCQQRQFMECFMNRCVECGKFRKWAELTETHFIPLNEFGPEESEFTCKKCLNNHLYVAQWTEQSAPIG